MVPELVKQMLAGGVIGEPVWFRHFHSRVIVDRKAGLTVVEIEDFYDRVDRVVRRAGTQIRAVPVPSDVSPDGHSRRRRRK